MPTPQPLNYSTDPLRRTRRWGRRAFYLGWVALTAWLAWDAWGRWAVAQATVLRRQAQCMNYREPPDRVVLERNPAHAARLLAGEGYRPSRDGWQSVDRTIAIFTAPERRQGALWEAGAPLDRLRELRTMPDVDAVPDFSDAPDFHLQTRPDEGADVFMHRRTPAAGGGERLLRVAAKWSDASDGAGTTLWFSADTLVPRRWTGEPEWGTPHDAVWAGRAGWPFRLALRDRTGLRLFAGQPDPADASRFAFRYEVGDAGGTIEGRLVTDGRVEMRALDGPFAAAGEFRHEGRGEAE